MRIREQVRSYTRFTSKSVLSQVEVQCHHLQTSNTRRTALFLAVISLV
jgi:hypothetical protein